MWTHDGFILHKDRGLLMVFADTAELLARLADKEGRLLPEWVGCAMNAVSVADDGWYQVNIGYRRDPTTDEIVWYGGNWIAKAGWR